MPWSELQGAGSQIIEALATNSSLTKHDLAWCGIEERGAVAIGEAMRTNTTLTQLDVSHNRISNWGAVAAADGLGANSTRQAST